jgi:hypothetical protein
VCLGGLFWHNQDDTIILELNVHGEAAPASQTTLAGHFACKAQP